MQCPKCGFENYPTASQCANCGASFDGIEKPTVPPMYPTPPSYNPCAGEERGRVSLLLYAGAGMIALSGLFLALQINSVLGGRAPPSFVNYAEAILIVGIALVIVGFAHQAKRMLE